MNLILFLHLILLFFDFFANVYFRIEKVQNIWKKKKTFYIILETACIMSNLALELLQEMFLFKIFHERIKFRANLWKIKRIYDSDFYFTSEIYFKFGSSKLDRFTWTKRGI